MRVVVAPDKYKGTLTAAQASSAIAAGVRIALPEAETAEIPMADGGEGTIDAIASGATASRRRAAGVSGPTGRRVEATWLELGGTCIVEAAAACGLHLNAPGRAAALAASTFGVGEIVARLRDAERVVLAVGGTASTDGGTGLASALGWRFVDAHGTELARGGGDLTRLHAIESPLRPPEVAVVAACDVTNPLLGPDGSARAYAPQKGAGPEEVALLERGLERLAQVIERDLGLRVGEEARGGAGGGLAAGAWAFLGAQLDSGFSHVARLTGLAAQIATADLVVTGEGRFDATTAAGKAPWGVAGLAHDAGVPCLLVAGEVAPDAPGHGFDLVVAAPEAGRDPRAALVEAVAAAVTRLAAP